MIAITADPIDVAEALKYIESDQAGAIDLFLGVVRDNTQERSVNRLEYEAYESMAVSEMKKIVDEAGVKWELLGWAVSHRVGTLVPGDVAVVVAVSTKHRKASFEACQFVIDKLKEHVPIFKKEVFEDGSEWISAKP